MAANPEYPIDLPAMLVKYAGGIDARLNDSHLSEADAREVSRLLLNGADIATPTTRGKIIEQIDKAVTPTTSAAALLRAREIVQKLR